MGELVWLHAFSDGVVNVFPVCKMVEVDWFGWCVNGFWADVE